MLTDTLELRVTAKRIETDDVVSFVFADPDGAELPAWQPGAHVDVLAGDVGQRQYSLCGDPGDRSGWRIAVLREDPGRGGSAHLHDSVQVGDTVQVGLPRNNFPLVRADRYVFVAGGIGITPMLPMIREAQAEGADWTLCYGGRTRGRMAFLDELAHHGERVRVWPEDELGLIPLAELVDGTPATVPIYCCGPESLLRAVELSCTSRPSGSLHIERFHPTPDAAAGPSNPFDVVVSSTGETVRVGADDSVLEALDRAGYPVPSSCREGTCASCETPVLEGAIDHRDSVLSEEEREASSSMMICVSRAMSGRLVLGV